jgi:general secretion pathway protein H
MTGPTSPTTDRRDRRGGFTLLELTLALAVMALVAGLVLPRVYPGGGATTARATAYSVAAVLRNDRNAALSGGAGTATRVDAAARTVSGASGSVQIPEDLDMSAQLGGDAVRFFPDGRSSGGAVVLKRGRTAYTVRVDPVTGGVMILTGSP